jgi:hypothetical protein
VHRCARLARVQPRLSPWSDWPAAHGGAELRAAQAACFPRNHITSGATISAFRKKARVLESWEPLWRTPMSREHAAAASCSADARACTPLGALAHLPRLCAAPHWPASWETRVHSAAAVGELREVASVLVSRDCASGTSVAKASRAAPDRLNGVLRGLACIDGVLRSMMRFGHFTGKPPCLLTMTCRAKQVRMPRLTRRLVSLD